MNMSLTTGPCKHSVKHHRHRDRHTVRLQCASRATLVTEDEYNRVMQARMNWSEPFNYHFDRGLYFHEVAHNLLVGTQPRSPSEIATLADHEHVTAILNLQQDEDIAHWGIDFGANVAACRDRGVNLIRVPARDFDGDSLRIMLPQAVRHLQAELERGSRVYVHCTAGLGRAPAVAIAWLYWFGARPWQLDEAYDHVTSIRPCGPKRDSVRGATYDLLDRGDRHHFSTLPSHAWAGLSDSQRRELQRRVMGR